MFRVNAPDHAPALTQFGRALRTLDIEAIHARTPQAKGRVDRANQPLQDRLVKEMWLAGIDTIGTANAWLPGFIEDYNQRFAGCAKHPEDAHRPVHHSDADLVLIMGLQEQRMLSRNLTFQYHNQLFQIRNQGAGYRLHHAEITVCKSFEGAITMLHQEGIGLCLLGQGRPASHGRRQGSQRHRRRGQGNTKAATGMETRHRSSMA